MDSTEAAESFAREHGPGRYDVDEIGCDPLPCGHTSQRLGVVITRPGETVKVDRDPWPD
jgi:hypothetical protein